MTNKQNENIVFFDSECNFCNYWVQFILKYDKNKIFKFASLQSDFAKNHFAAFNINPSLLNTLYYSGNGKNYKKSTAVLKIANKLSGFFRIFLVFYLIPRFLRDIIYDFIAKHRRKLLKNNQQCLVPDADTRKRFYN